MEALLALSRWIDRFNWLMSRVAIWLVLLAALLSAFNAFFRYSIEAIVTVLRKYPGLSWLQAILDWYSRNSNGFLETQWYMFTGMIMLGAAYTLKVNEHVRVDLFYGWVSERTRVWIDLVGTIVCLMPMCILLIYFTWPWFMDSWRINEQSTNAGGLVRWPVKLTLVTGFAFVLLQGVSELIKCIAALTVSGYAREHHYEKPLQ